MRVIIESKKGQFKQNRNKNEETANWLKQNKLNGKKDLQRNENYD